MAGLNGWEVVLLIVATYVAVVSLVRLMARRRDKLLDDLSQDLKRASRNRWRRSRWRGH